MPIPQPWLGQIESRKVFVRPRKRGYLLAVVQTEAAIWGPSYRELSDPASIPEDLREAARVVRLEGAQDPFNLYNLHWSDDLGEVTSLVLPSELTGVSTPIAVMFGEKFPTGSVHTAAAYAMLMERQLHREIIRGHTRLLVPSTGAFGLGAAWVARLMGYRLTAVIPKSSRSSRAPALEALGAAVIDGGAGPADTLDTIDAAWSAKGDDDVVLNPYDDFASYRYHAVVTSSAARSLATSLAGAGVGRGRVTAFVAPTGAGALLAAGDGLPGTAVIAAEPSACAPLADGGWDSHDVPDAGPRVPLWNDHVTAFDAAVAVGPGDLEIATRLLAQSAERLAAIGLRDSIAQRLSRACGPAACLAVIAALKAVHYFGFSSSDLVLVSAPEGAGTNGVESEGQPSPTETEAKQWLRHVRRVRSDGVVEATTALRRRWHNQKYAPWVERRGKGADALRRQQDDDFWAEQRRWSESIDQRILASRGLT